ncbi:8619_t:CDS:2 [Entrophospora sp. SA101]|nr:8619_t:CDS:2 [Entrophospora sp. SA101]
MTFITAIFVTWEVSGIQDQQIELGLENAQHPYNKIAINRDVNLTTKSQDLVVPTVPNGIYQLYMRGPNFFRTSNPFSIYTTSATQTGMNTPTPNTPNSGGGTEDNSTRNTVIGAVVGGIFSVIAATIGAAIAANFIRCKCCGDNLSQNDDLKSGVNDSRHNGGDGGGEISQDSINNL